MAAAATFSSAVTFEGIARSYANQTPALAVVLALIGDLIDKMQVENTTAFKIDRGFESKIGLGYRPVPQIEAPK